MIHRNNDDNMWPYLHREATVKKIKGGGQKGGGRERKRDIKSTGNKWIIKGECGGRSASDWKEGGDVCGPVSRGKMQCALPRGGYLPPTVH